MAKAATNFDEFVRREQEEAAALIAQKIDWDAEKSAWLEHLKALYTAVEGFLGDYIRTGQVAINYELINLEEELIGSYSAKQMNIRIGRKILRLKPVGTFLIGSKGRVDLVGPLGSVQIILLNRDVKTLSDMVHVSVSIDGRPMSPSPKKRSKDIKWEWRIVTRPPRRDILDLNKDNFLNLLAGVADG